MTLYYQDELVTLYHGDCLTDHREWLEADVLVTDPPYGMGYESNFNRDRRNVKLGRPVAAEQNTDARDSALSMWTPKPAILFGRWSCPRPAGVKARLIWDKGNTVGMGDLPMPWGPTDEEIYVVGKGFVGKRESNVIRSQMLMSGDHSRPDHPTPKPIPLMERLIEKCPPGVVADPFAGSGATLVAATNLGRKSVGVELEERYCELIAKRLSNHTMTFDFGTGA